MKRLTFGVFLLMGVVLFYGRESEAACCSKPCSDACGKMSKYCHDCVISKFAQCCGQGSCNIFCCNCDGGCRSGVKCWNCDCKISYASVLYGHHPYSLNGSERDPDEQRESDAHMDAIFAESDVDGDGRLSYREAINWLEGNKPSLAKSANYFDEELRKLDTDNDGYLTKREIDQ